MLGVLYLLLVCLGIASGFGFSYCGGSWLLMLVGFGFVMFVVLFYMFG